MLPPTIAIPVDGPVLTLGTLLGPAATVAVGLCLAALAVVIVATAVETRTRRPTPRPVARGISRPTPIGRPTHDTPSAHAAA